MWSRHPQGMNPNMLTVSIQPFGGGHFLLHRIIRCHFVSEGPSYYNDVCLSWAGSEQHPEPVHVVTKCCVHHLHHTARQPKGPRQQQALWDKQAHTQSPCTITVNIPDCAWIRFPIKFSMTLGDYPSEMLKRERSDKMWSGAIQVKCLKSGSAILEN